MAVVIQVEHLICCLKGFYLEFERPQLGCSITRHMEMQTSTESKDGSTAFQLGQDFKTSLDSLSDLFVMPYLGSGTLSRRAELLRSSEFMFELTDDSCLKKEPDNTLLNYSRSWL